MTRIKFVKIGSNKILEYLEEQVSDMRYYAEQTATSQKTQKEKRYHEGRAAAFQSVMDLLFRIDIK